MKVSEMMDECLRLVGRGDVADGSAGDGQRVRYILLLSINAVLDELARGYFPLGYTQQFDADGGKISFDRFDRTPVKIVCVRSGGRKVKWRIAPDGLLCDGASVTVHYEYVPDRLKESDEFVYPDRTVGASLVEYGMAAEYFLICGDAASAAAWESKYRGEIDRLMSLQTVRGTVPPRRWI